MFAVFAVIRLVILSFCVFGLIFSKHIQTIEVLDKAQWPKSPLYLPRHVPRKKQHNNTTTLNIVQPSLTIHHSRNLSSFPFEVCHWQTRTQHLGDLPSVLSMTRKSQKITTGQARVSQHGYVKKCEALPCLAKKKFTQGGASIFLLALFASL